MELNVSSFCNALQNAEPQKSLDAGAVSPYLLEHLFVPYLQGEDIRLDSLDYDAFDLSDLDRLNEFIEDIECIQNQNELIPRNLEKCAPAVKPAGMYC